MINCTIIIPAVEQSRLDICLDSLDESILENVIVYKNAPNIAVKHKILSLEGSGKNDGISTAWNVGRRQVVNNQQDYLIILSQNVKFDDGMRDFLANLSEDRPKYGVWSTLGWHLLALSRETLEKVGEFDTNCYPAYYEDNEYAIRMHKSKILDEIYEIPVAADVKSGLSTTLGIRVDVEPIKQYVIRKWGETLDWTHYHSQPFYDTPFNDPTKSLDYFEKKTTEQMMKDYGYEDRIEDLYVKDAREYL